MWQPSAGGSQEVDLFCLESDMPVADSIQSPVKTKSSSICSWWLQTQDSLVLGLRFAASEPLLWDVQGNWLWVILFIEGFIRVGLMAPAWCIPILPQIMVYLTYHSNDDFAVNLVFIKATGTFFQFVTKSKKACKHSKCSHKILTFDIVFAGSLLIVRTHTVQTKNFTELPKCNESWALPNLSHSLHLIADYSLINGTIAACTSLFSSKTRQEVQDRADKSSAFTYRSAPDITLQSLINRIQCQKFVCVHHKLTAV